MPVSVGAGKQVYAGTVNLEGAITVEVTSRFADSSVARILELVEQASANKAPIERFITRFARYYTPAVVFIAALVAVIPPLAGHGTFDEWLYLSLIHICVATGIGEERMQRGLDRIGYGNRDISGGLTRFWLQSSLKISPREQVGLLRALFNGCLLYTSCFFMSPS